MFTIRKFEGKDIPLTMSEPGILFLDTELLKKNIFSVKDESEDELISDIITVLKNFHIKTFDTLDDLKERLANRFNDEFYPLRMAIKQDMTFEELKQHIGSIPQLSFKSMYPKDFKIPKFKMPEFDMSSLYPSSLNFSNLGPALGLSEGYTIGETTAMDTLNSLMNSVAKGLGSNGEDFDGDHVEDVNPCSEEDETEDQMETLIDKFRIPYKSAKGIVG
jgi:hypothetical protein